MPRNGAIRERVKGEVTMAKLKIKKNDLKQDELRDFFDHAGHWLTVQYATRRQAFIGVVVAVGLVLLGIPGWMAYRDHQNTQASGLLSEGKTAIRVAQQMQDPASRAEKLREALAKLEELTVAYGSSSSYPEALKSIGQANAELGLSEPAAAAYQRFLRELADHPDADLVRFTLAGLLQDMGKYDEAVKEYEILLNRDEALYLKQYVVYKLASLYDAGLKDPEKAIGYYRQMEKPKAGEMQLWYFEARHRLAALGSPLPEESIDTPGAVS